MHIYSSALPDQVKFKNYNLNILQIGKISTKEILNVIKSLKPNSSMGIDDIPAYFHKAFAEILSIHLKPMFTLLVQKNIFPDKFKTPIHKSGNRSQIENFPYI